MFSQKTGLPKSVDAITTEWLSHALSEGGQDVRVASVRHECVIHGAGTKALLTLDYAHGAAGLPRRMWVKASWEPHGDIGHCAVREALFYGEFASRVAVRAPMAFYAGWNAAEDQGVILIEDLGENGSELWDCRFPRSVDDVASQLENLARLHAKHWDDPALLSMPLIDIPIRADGPTAAWPRANGAKRISEMLDSPRGDPFPARIKHPEK